MPRFPHLPPGLKQRLLAGLGGLAVAPAFAAGPALPPGLPTSPGAWRAAAQADIEEAVQVMRENHPGAHDPHNPAFPARLEAARRHGLALAARVADAPGYVAAVDGFTARIGDGHAGMRVLIDAAALPPPRWPGFVTVWRGDALYVWAAHAGGPAAGSRLLGCDGRRGEALIRENVFGFQGRVAEAGQWWSAAPALFVDTHNPFVKLPQHCRFEQDGKVDAYALSWRALDAEGRRWQEESESGDVHPAGMTEPRPNLAWVAMPTFHPDEQERAAYRAVARDAVDNRARWLAYDAVVIDLRKNGGGSSGWSQAFARALWGGERVDRALAAFDARSEVWWRASQANTDYLLSASLELDTQGQPDMAAWLRDKAHHMRAALARGELFYVEQKDEDKEKSKDREAGPASEARPPFTRPVYVVVPGGCASACLDALDVFTRFPNTTLIGAPSSADSTYMDVRRHPLASGLSRVTVPNKMYVNRGRANGQIYPAALEVRDLVWSTATLSKAVEADLARRRSTPGAGGVQAPAGVQP